MLSDNNKSAVSLRRRILSYVLASGAAVVLFYSVLVGHYFFLGESLSIKYAFNLDATDYAKRYAKDQNAPLPGRTNLYAYRDINNFPRPLLKLFPVENYAHREILRADRDLLFGFSDSRAIHMLPGYCGGELCDAIYFYSYQLEDGQWLYLVAGSEFDEALDEELSNYLLLTIPIAACFLLIILILAYVLIRNVDRPIRHVADWAEKLTLEDLDQPLPDFYFRELNRVAERLYYAFQRIGHVLENEHQFLRNASHELRTPIAVMSVNLALLDKIVKKQPRGRVEKKSIDRLNRAVLTMQQLTETLLWLSRNEDTFPESECVSLGEMIECVIEDNRYLLEHKHVDVTFNPGDSQVNIPVTLCRIVLTNLIRNAFQYTHDGNVSIVVDSSSVIISNKGRGTRKGTGENSDYGFGLGLILVQQIVDKLGWSYQSESTESGRSAIVNIGSSPTRIPQSED